VLNLWQQTWQQPPPPPLGWLDGGLVASLGSVLACLVMGLSLTIPPLTDEAVPDFDTCWLSPFDLPFFLLAHVLGHCVLGQFTTAACHREWDMAGDAALYWLGVVVPMMLALGTLTMPHLPRYQRRIFFITMLCLTAVGTVCFHTTRLFLVPHRPWSLARA
jgi:hypothetical protein